MRTLGNIPAAGAASAEALQLLEQLQHDGDNSEATTIALALGMTVQARILNNQQNPAALPTALRAVALLKPLAEAPNASLATRHAYVEALVHAGFEQANSISLMKDAVGTEQLAMSTAALLGARDLSNMAMAAQYGEAGAWLTGSLGNLGRTEDAQRVGADAITVVDKLLEQRPGYLLALHAQEILTDALGGLALFDMRPADAITLGKRSETISLSLIKMDSKNTVSYNNLAVNLNQLGDASWQMGRPREAFDYYRQSLEAISHASTAGASFVMNNTVMPTVELATKQADVGDSGAANATLAAATRVMTGLRQSEPNRRFLSVFGQCLLSFGESDIALWRGDPTTTRRTEIEMVGLMQGMTSHGASEEFWKTVCITYGVELAGQADYMLGDPAATEKSMRAALAMRKNWPTHNDFDRRDEARIATLLAMALAREGHTADAEQVITPVVKFHRELAARNHGDEFQHVELASALYAQALADKRMRPALLKEADALVSRVPAAMRDLHSVRLWRDRIREELHAGAAAVSHGAVGRVAG
jgi:tetratricopeptide (TPR) repeat protein